MRFAANAVCAHASVAVLPESARTAYLALLRAADEWGEIERKEAARVARRALALSGHDDTVRGALDALHVARLVDTAGEGRVVVWTPKQREDAAIFAAPLDWIDEVKL